MAEPRKQCAVVAVGDAVYAIGGCRYCTVPVTHQDQKRPCVGSEQPLGTLEVLELRPNERRLEPSWQWRTLASMRRKRWGAAVVVVGEEIFVMGGYDGTAWIKDVEVYDMDMDHWRNCRWMTSRRMAAGMVQVGGHILLIGGFDGLTYLNSVECYDPASDRWYHMPAMFEKRARMGITEIDGRVYVMGGYDGVKALDTMEMLDLREGVESADGRGATEYCEWRRMSSMKSARCSFNSVTISTGFQTEEGAAANRLTGRYKLPQEGARELVQLDQQYDASYGIY